MKKVLTFGELLIRQQAVDAAFFTSNNNFLKIYPGGSEANVAVSLAKMGTSVSYLSAAPDHQLTQAALKIMQEAGVNTQLVKKQGDRIGSYLLLSGNGLSKGDVIYDRKYSSFSQLKQETIDWDKVLSDVDWLHWTALSPALNPDLTLVLKEGLMAAQQKNITISVDLNYRNKLWQYGKNPIEIMPELAAYCQVIMGNIWAANIMLGTSIDLDFDRDTPSEKYLAFAQQSAEEIFNKFPKCQHVANTFRFMDNPKHNLFYGTYHTRKEHVSSPIMETNEVVDRIGSGDAFMAGAIYGMINEYTAQEIINTATGAGFQKLFTEGDFGSGKIA